MPSFFVSQGNNACSLCLHEPADGPVSLDVLRAHVRSRRPREKVIALRKCPEIKGTKEESYLTQSRDLNNVGLLFV